MRYKLTIILILWQVCNIVVADVKCDNALHTCIDYNTQLDNSIKLCNEAQEECLEQLKKDNDPLIPWWVWAIIGGSAGSLLMYEIKR